MRKHWRYLLYVIRHKWYVFLACLYIKVPLWQAIIHDWQKFTLEEWTPYVLSFYGPWRYKERPQWLVDKFNRAWLHHQHYGPHHWQHWVLREDSGNVIALEIPYRFVLEMVADWVGAGRAITGKIEVAQWYASNKNKMVLHPDTRHAVEVLLHTYYGLSSIKERVEGVVGE